MRSVKPLVGAVLFVGALVAASAATAQSMEGAEVALEALSKRAEPFPVAIPPTVFWRYAIVLPEPPGPLYEEANRWAMRSHQAANGGLEARFLALAGMARLERANDADAIFRRAWVLSDEAGDVDAAALARLQVARRAYLAGDPAGAQLHGAAVARTLVDRRRAREALLAISLCSIAESSFGIGAADASGLEEDSGMFESAFRRDAAHNLKQFAQLFMRGADAAPPRPLSTRLRSAGLEITAADRAWVRLIDAYQLAAAGDKSAIPAWGAAANDDSADPRARGFAWLALAYLEDEPKAAVDALSQARRQFQSAAWQPGIGQAHLAAAAIHYRAGNVPAARTELAAARAAFAATGSREALAGVELLRSMGEWRAKNPAEAIAAASAAERIVQPLAEEVATRLPEKVVQDLRRFMDELPELHGGADTRSLERRIAESYRFREWARATRDPMLEVLSLGFLGKQLSEAGYEQDAAYYQMLGRRRYAAYRAMVPLAGRLMRAALLDFDLIAGDDASLSGTLLDDRYKVGDFKKVIEKAMTASLEQLKDPRLGLSAEWTPERIETAKSRIRATVGKFIDRLDSALRGYGAAIAAGNRLEAARQLAAFIRVLEEFGDVMGAGTIESTRQTTTTRSERTDLTASDRRPLKIEGRVESTYIVETYDLSAAEQMHRSTSLRYTRDLMLAGLLKDQARAASAAREMASFYDLHRHAVEPPDGIDLPVMVEKPADLDPSKVIDKPPGIEKRKKYVQEAIRILRQRTSDSIEKRFRADSGDDMDTMEGILDDRGEAMEFFNQNFQVKTQVLADEHELTADDKERRVRLRYAYTSRVTLRRDAPFFQAPKLGSGNELWWRLPSVAFLAEARRAPSAASWGDVIDAMSAKDLKAGLVEALLGPLKGDPTEEYSGFAKLLVLGNIVLSARSRSEAPLPESWPSYGSLRSEIEANPGARAFLEGLLAARAKLDTPIEDMDFAEALKAFMKSMEEGLAAAGSEQSVKALIAGGLMQITTQPLLAEHLLGRQAEAAAEAGRLRTRLERGERDAERRFPETAPEFQIALFHMLASHWSDASAQLGKLYERAGPAANVDRYQLAFLVSICEGRRGDRQAQLRWLELSVDALDRIRASLRSRARVSALGPLRQVVYEAWLDALRDAKDVVGESRAMARYKRPSRIPAPLFREATALSAAQRADLLELREIYHTASSLRVALQSDVAHAFLAQFVDQFARKGKAGEATDAAQQAMSDLSEVLTSEVAGGDLAEPGVRPAAPDELVLWYFVGARSVHILAMDSNGTNAISRAIPGAEVAKRVTAFRKLIDARQPIATEAAALHRLLLGSVPRLDRVKRLTIWPDGVLNLLPFGALRDPRSNRYVAQSHDLSILTGATVARQGIARARPGSTLIVANPDGSLPSTEVEAKALAEMQSLGARPPLLGNQATVAQVRQALPSVSNVHFAIHARFSDRHPNFSFLQFADERLYSLDLASLDFSGREIYLGACETRVASVLPGDDVYGMADAFLAAGAKSLVATLWRIESESSSLFAQGFYQPAVTGSGPAQRLGTTMRDFISRRTWRNDSGTPVFLDHPYYWAGYVYVVPAFVQ